MPDVGLIAINQSQYSPRPLPGIGSGIGRHKATESMKRKGRFIGGFWVKKKKKSSSFLLDVNKETWSLVAAGSPEQDITDKI